jgi:hypothetical protein
VRARLSSDSESGFDSVFECFSSGVTVEFLAEVNDPGSGDPGLVSVLGL